MLGMLAPLLSSVGGVLAMLAVVAGVFGAGMYEEHKIGLGKISALKIEYAQAQARAAAVAAEQQKRYDDQAIASAETERRQQAVIAAQRRQSQSEIVKYVPAIRACVPLGLVRVLHAAAIGMSAGDVPLAAGKSDDACAATGWPDLARSIVGDFATARANAAQLNALIDFMRQAKAAAK